MHTRSLSIARRHPAETTAAKLLLVLLACASATGCVRRRLTLRTNPPGALVYVDNQEIGTTPCSVDFTYYGTRELRFVKAGYETLTVNQPIPAPWYQVPPLDFISDNFALQRIRDNRTVSFNLQPQMMLPVEEVIRRGEELRGRSLTGPVVPVSSSAIPPLPAEGVPNTGSPFSGPAQPQITPPGGFGPVRAAPPTPALTPLP